MTDKKDDNQQTPAPTGSGTTGSPSNGPKSTGPSVAATASGDPKRPHATLDLKAIEVKSAPPKADAKPTGSASPSAAPVDPKPTPTTSGTSPGTGTASPAGSSSLTGSSAKPQSPPKSAAQAPQPRPIKQSGLGSVLTHMTAGVVGGAMAWYGVTTLGPQLGLPGLPDTTAAMDVMSRKLATLEKTIADKTAAPSADLAAKLKVAEDKLGKLDMVNKSVAELSAAQARLAADAKSLSDKLAAQSGTEGAGARIARLEERLKLMTDAAVGDPQTGKLPQIAAIAGSVTNLDERLTNELSALRKTVSQELEQRLSLTNETSEAAKSGTSRIDRDLASVKSEAAVTTEKIAKLKSESDRLTAAVQGIRDDGNALKTSLEAVKSDMDAKFKSVARPADVASALAPVAGKLSSLEQNVQTVVKSEADRKTNSERVLLALELNNLKRVLERGQPYAAELAGVTKAAGGKVDLTILERYKDTGITPISGLASDFTPVANAIIDAATEPVEGTFMDKMLAGAKSVIRVRKLSYASDDKSAEAVVGRMEADLKEGRMVDVLAESKNIPAKAQGAAQDWLVKVEGRAAVERAIAGLEAALKTSIAGGPADPAPQTPPTPTPVPSKG